MFLSNSGKLITLTSLFVLSFSAREPESAEAGAWTLLPVKEIGNQLPPFLPPICAKDSLTRDEAIKEIHKMLREPGYLNTASPERGHFYKITSADGAATILVLGTAHAMPLFYRRELNNADSFRRVVQDAGIETVYTEIDPRTWCTVPQMGKIRFIGKQEHEIKNSFRTLGLKYRGLETPQNLKFLDSKLPVRSHTIFSQKHKSYNSRTCLLMKAYVNGSRYLTAFFDTLEGPHPVQIQRNLHWMQTVERQLENHEPTLFAVGVAHLYGEHGLLNLCAERRWKIESQPIGIMHAYGTEHVKPWPIQSDWNLTTCPRFREVVRYLKHVKGWPIDMNDLFKVAVDRTDYNMLLAHNCIDPDYKLPAGFREILSADPEFRGYLPGLRDYGLTPERDTEVPIFAPERSGSAAEGAPLPPKND